MSTRSNTSAARKARMAAVDGLAKSAMLDVLNRETFLASIRTAVGKTGAQLAAMEIEKANALLTPVRRNLTVGYMAAALPSNGTEDERIARVIDLLDNHAAYVDPKSGKAPKLPNGKSGRRTKEQERAYGNARDRASRAIADAGLSVTRTTTKTKNNKQSKAPTMAGGKKSAAPAPIKAPTKSDAPMMEKLITDIGRAKAPNASEMVLHTQRMAASLLAYWNKNAKVQGAPVALSSAIEAFKAEVDRIAVASQK